MSEITKLYENAGIKKQIPKVCSSNELYCKECEAHIEDAMPYCKNAEYPPFTAEKVLKVIVFFLNKGVRLDFSVEEDTKISVENFKECIAQIGAKYWQDLTKEEQQQVKGILE